MAKKRKVVVLHPDDFREIDHLTIGGQVVDVVCDRFGVTTKGEMIVIAPPPPEFMPFRYLQLVVPQPSHHILHGWF